MIEVVLREWSGVTRRGGALLVVDDDARGEFHQLDLGPSSGPYIEIGGAAPRSIGADGAFVTDLEAIDHLGDRVVVLSERLRAILVANATGVRPTMVEYPHALAVFGNRSLEGLAIRPKVGAADTSRVAVLWEGGYPDFDRVPHQLRSMVGRIPLTPVVVTHDLSNGITVDGEVNLEAAGVGRVALRVPPLPGKRGELSQFFRAPDLVWHKNGFIVLLSSQDSPPEGRPDFRYKLLQRYDIAGVPIGRAIDIDEQQIVKDRGLRNANWEGLGWWDSGSSLVLVFDKYPKDVAPAAIVIDLPDDWK